MIPMIPMTDELNVDGTLPITSKEFSETVLEQESWFHVADRLASMKEQEISVVWESWLNTIFIDVGMQFTGNNASQKVANRYETAIKGDLTTQVTISKEASPVGQAGEAGGKAQTDEVSETISNGGHPPLGALIDLMLSPAVIMG